MPGDHVERAVVESRGPQRSLIFLDDLTGLIDVFMRNGQERADIEINAVVYNNLREGEEFGPGLNYELRSISGNCVVVLFGVGSSTLCVDPQT